MEPECHSVVDALLIPFAIVLSHAFRNNLALIVAIIGHSLFGVRQHAQRRVVRAHWRHRPNKYGKR